MFVVNAKIKVPLQELDFSFSRSSGPGGQNVNKVNTKATLRWYVSVSPSVPAAIRARFLLKYRRRLTNDGELIVTSQRYRDQGRNVADCLSKLRVMLALVTDAPKTRKKSRPTRASQAKRRKNKEVRARTKQLRRPPGPEP
jgi:ribosome-associated protein